MVNHVLWGLVVASFICVALLESQMRLDIKGKDPSLRLEPRSPNQAHREHARLFPQSNKRKLVFVAYSFLFVGLGLIGFGVFK